MPDKDLALSRISPYTPEHCDKAIEFLSPGYSIIALAGEFGVCRATVYNWRKEHPEFEEAVQIGLAKGGLSWEKRLIGMADGTGQGNVTAAIFGLKNRASEEWHDRTEFTGKDGGPIEVNDPGSKELARQLLHVLTRPST